MMRFIGALFVVGSMAIFMWLGACFVAWQWLEIPTIALRLAFVVWPFLSVLFLIIQEAEKGRVEMWRKVYGRNE
ncbi:MAG: hypothetical protein HWE35_21280 [Rhodobacteraceae bacterium]|nr:hypothetical protein [Paracoccaceae bacterium]